MKKNIVTLVIIMLVLSVVALRGNQASNKQISGNANYIYGLAAAASSDGNKTDVEASSSAQDEKNDDGDVSQTTNGTPTLPLLPVIDGIEAIIGSFEKGTDNEIEPADPEAGVSEDCKNGINCDQCGDYASECRRSCVNRVAYGECEKECSVFDEYTGERLYYYLNKDTCVACVNPKCDYKLKPGDLPNPGSSDDPGKSPNNNGGNSEQNTFEFCENSNVLRTLHIIHRLLTIAQILVPLAIIVLASIDYGKAVISADDNAIRNATTSAIKKLIVGLIIFFVPVIIYSILHLIDKAQDVKSSFSKCDVCLTGKNANGKNEDCEY